MITLKQLALNLEKVAQKYVSQDNDVQNLLNSLDDMLLRAKNEAPIDKEESVPGFYWFSEGGLSKYKDLEEAYSKFSLFITAGTQENYENMLKAVASAVE